MSLAITKSIRFAAAEAEELNWASRQTSVSEASLMKKWVLEGMRRYKLERAVHAYMERKTDLREGATMADVSYNHFLHEVQKRNIVILEEDEFLDRAGYLADTFDNVLLRQAVDHVGANAI